MDLLRYHINGENMKESSIFFFFYVVEHRIIIICLFGIRALCFFLSTGHPMMGGGGEAHPGLGAEHPGFD